MYFILHTAYNVPPIKKWYVIGILFCISNSIFCKNVRFKKCVKIRFNFKCKRYGCQVHCTVWYSKQCALLYTANLGRGSSESSIYIALRIHTAHCANSKNSMIVCHSKHLDYPSSFRHRNKELMATSLASEWFLQKPWFAFVHLFWTEHVFDSILEKNTAWKCTNLKQLRIATILDLHSEHKKNKIKCSIFLTPKIHLQTQTLV